MVEPLTRSVPAIPPSEIPLSAAKRICARTSLRAASLPPLSIPSMAAIPTLEDEDARRPGRERQILVGERTRILNRLKANLARLGIRGFRPNLARAPSQLGA